MESEKRKEINKGEIKIQKNLFSRNLLVSFTIMLPYVAPPNITSIRRYDIKHKLKYQEINKYILN